MRHAILALALAGAAVSGCHDHDDHDDVITGSPWYITYGNGHPIAASSSDPVILPRETELMGYVNDHRVALGAPALIEHGLMRDLARAHSIHMSISGFTSTVNPEGDGPGARATIAGLPWTMYAENIEAGVSSAWNVYQEWAADSWTHDHIHDPNFTHAAVGYEHDSSSTWNSYWTMDFRRP
jgi:uncharacterized protein YkwD